MTPPLHPAWDELEGEAAPVFETIRTWTHPSLPGVTVERHFEVIAPTEVMANRTAHIHFLLALAQMGFRFNATKKWPGPPNAPST